MFLHPLTLTTLLFLSPNLPPMEFDTAVARQHLSILASDEMRGRHTPSPELDRSAEYLAQRLRDAGCEPVNGSYFHEYTLQLLDLAQPTSLSIVSDAGRRTLDVKTDFVPFGRTGEGTVTNARVVFVGYGITAPELNFDEYAGLDVKGAVVVVIRGEPAVSDSTKPFGGKRPTRHASNDVKVENARKHGAVAMLVVDPMRSGGSPRVFGAVWPSLYPEQGHEYNPVILGDAEPSIPTLSVGEAVIRSLFGSTTALFGLRVKIDSTLTPYSKIIDGSTISCQVTLDRQIQKVKNVMAMLPGTSNPEEFVVMGAHYDHVGVGKPVQGDSIFNGADDNASGTTALLLAASALSPKQARPERSMLFVAFSGEERGLLGSKAFTDHPPLDLKNCVAMINLDMIGRCDNSKLSIGGHLYCPDLIKINEEENAALQRPLKLAYDIESYFYRSDQASFARKQIPVLFYFTGEHGDYHKVTDEISKVNLPDMVNITQLATRVAWRAAGMPRTRFVNFQAGE
ncbi:MAG: M28 family peptidase [Ignavibacteriae bacterium]|nr:MAG: M28 family peptidase [Ignavibacteriota bacterium]